MNHCHEGDKALEAKDYKAAIDSYTKALQSHPTSPSYHIKRSTAYLRLKPEDGGPKYQESLGDAETGLLLAIQRGKREIMLEAQLRRGIALYQLGRYGDANCALAGVRKAIGPPKQAHDSMNPAAAMSLGTNSSKQDKTFASLDMWESKTKNALEKLPEDDPKRKCTIEERPTTQVPGEEELRKRYQEQARGAAPQPASSTSQESSGLPDKTSTAQPQIAQQTNAAATQKVRHEWYQTHDDLVITFYVKGISKEQAQFEFNEKSFDLTINMGPSHDYNFSLDPLYSTIDPEASTAKMMSVKIEVRLRKKASGIKWPKLEGAKEEKGKQKENAPLVEASLLTKPTTTPASTTEQTGPAYPTSSRKGVKDWDKLAAELSKKNKEKGKSEAQGHKAGSSETQGKDKHSHDAEQHADEEEDDEDDDEYGSDPVDRFFKKLYAQADPDTRRAMMKSYYESQGTALSTNWAEVGKKKVDVQKEEA